MDGFSIPHFDVSQDTDHVFVDVSCPEGAAAATPNVAVEGRIFGFHLEPYYLPLVLPGAATGSSTEARSQNEQKYFRVTLNKAQPGEWFEGLEQLQPQLLPEDQMKQAMADAEQSKGFFQPSRGDASSSRATDDAAKSLLQQALRSQGLTAVNDDDGEASFDSSALPAARGGASTSKDADTSGAGFGFGWRSSFRGSLIPAGCADTRNVLEVPSPAAVEPAQREQAALAFEEEHWDEGIYMDNFLDVDGELKHLLHLAPNIPTHGASSSTAFNEDANVDLEALALLLQLLFAYSYDERTNEGDPTVESGWTIAKLCRSLAASTPPQTIHKAGLEAIVTSTLVGCARRALTVPLYRHWGLTLACITDTCRRLRAGAAHIRNCLDGIASRLESGEDAILCRLSEIWVAPLIGQLPTEAALARLAVCIEQIAARLTKDQVGGGEWDLEVLEEAAKQAYEDGEGGFV